MLERPDEPGNADELSSGDPSIWESTAIVMIDEEFDQALAKENPPDLRDFWQKQIEANALPADQRVPLLCQLLLTQREHAWKRGDQRPLEDDLQACPELRESPEAMKRLSLHQCVLQQTYGDGKWMKNRGEFAPTIIIEQRVPSQPIDITLTASNFPQQIGRYRVVRLLGSGGFGTVYLAHDERDQPVAIKVPRADLRLNSTQIDEYRQEANTLAALDHPRIVRVLEIGESDEYPVYVVTTFVDGGTLTEWTQLNKPDFLAIATLIADVAEALHVTHLHNIFHRDIKPANLLMSSDGRAHLADFGLALIDGEEDDSLPIIRGTFHYMSPEQAAGEGHRVDGRTDIYSLGSVLYELLAGRKPMRFSKAAKTHDICHQIQSREPRPPRQINDQIPKELERIALKALAKQQRDRYTTAHDMADDLREWATRWPCAEEETDNKTLEESATATATAWLSSWDFDAVIAEKSRGFAGREWLFAMLDDWKASGQESFLLIAGNPGSGKSSIIAELARRHHEHQVIAWHFCQADTAQTMSAWMFVRQLAAQLSQNLPGYAEQLNTTVVKQALSAAACKEDPATAFDIGILSPLQKLSSQPSRPVLLLIDALDESLVATSAGQSIGIVQLLSLRLNRFPPWLRLIATTRRDPDVLNRLRGHRVLELESNHASNRSDLDAYIACRLESPLLRSKIEGSGRPHRRFVDQLLEKSDGNFLYAQQTLDGIERDVYPISGIESLPPGLFGIYQTFFERQFPTDETFSDPRKVLQLILAAKEPLAESLLASASGLDEDDELPIVLRRLAVFLRQRTDGDGIQRFSVFHKSLADWLSAPSLRGTRFFINVRRGQDLLAEYCLAEFRRGENFVSRYTARNLPAHLLAAQRWEDLEAVLCDLTFMHTKCHLGLTFELVCDYREALQSLPELDGMRRASQQRLESLEQYACELMDYSQHPNGRQLPLPPDSTLWLKRLTSGREELRSHAVDRRRAERIEMFSQFIDSSSHILELIPEVVVPTARNSSSHGPITEQADQLCARRTRPWIARDPRPAVEFGRSARVRTLFGHSGHVLSVDLTSTGSVAVSASADHDVRVWDLETGRCLRTLTGHQHWVNRVCVSADGRRAVSASRDGTLRVWDIATGEVCDVLKHDTTPITALAITPDGDLALTGNQAGLLQLWEVGSGRMIAVLNSHQNKVDHDHKNKVNAVAMTPDGTRAVSVGRDGMLCVWDLVAGRNASKIRVRGKDILGVALSPDGQTALTSGTDLSVRTWRLAVKAVSQDITVHRDAVWAVTMSADGKTAFSASDDRSVSVIDVGRGETVATLRGHTGKVRCVACTPDAKTLVTGATDRNVIVWDWSRGDSPVSTVGHDDWVMRMAAAPDGTRFVSGDASGTVHVWNADTGAIEQTIQKARNLQIHALAATASGNVIYTLEDDPRLRLVSLQTGEEVLAPSGDRVGIRCVAVSADSRWAYCGRMDGSVLWWDLTAKQVARVADVHRQPILNIALSADGRSGMSASADNTVCIWDASTGKPVAVLKGHTDRVTSVAVSFDSRIAVTGSEDGTARVWNLETFTTSNVFSDHVGRVNGVALTSDGRLAVSAGSDQTLRVWDVKSGRQVTAYCANAAILAMSPFTHSGRFACGASDGQVHLLTLHNWQ